MIRNLAKKIGVLPYLKVFREKFFPTEYYKNSLIDDKRYINFYSTFINTNDLCFDVGAHSGHRTNIFLKLGAKVVAVEPQKELFEYLKIKFGKKINIENIGLGSSERKMTMYLSETSSLSTFSTEWLSKAQDRFADVKWDNKREIQISTLDNLIEKYGIPKFCKIDVEGFEFEVLKGLSKSISYISFEFMTPENSELIINCLQYLHKLDANIEINYSIGDSLQMTLSNWINYDNAITYFENNLFNQPNWGDIYVKMK
jgi:FkbM family methyltransferase